MKHQDPDFEKDKGKLPPTTEEPEHLHKYKGDEKAPTIDPDPPTPTTEPPNQQ